MQPSHFILYSLASSFQLSLFSNTEFSLLIFFFKMLFFNRKISTLPALLYPLPGPLYQSTKRNSSTFCLVTSVRMLVHLKKKETKRNEKKQLRVWTLPSSKWTAWLLSCESQHHSHLKCCSWLECTLNVEACSFRSKSCCSVNSCISTIDPAVSMLVQDKPSLNLLPSKTVVCKS